MQVIHFTKTIHSFKENIVSYEICDNCIHFQVLTGCEKFPKIKASFQTPSCHDFDPVWVNLPKGTQTRREQIAYLKEMLPKLQNTPDATIYFGGVTTRPGTKINGLGIRFMKTAGGPQYQLFMIDGLEREHSSSYYTDIFELTKWAIVAAGRYMHSIRSNIGNKNDRITGTTHAWYQ